MSEIESEPGRRWVMWCVYAALGVLVIAGFMGLDRAFYERVSLRLYTANPLDHDFYARTERIWLVFRILIAHVVGAAIAFTFVGLLHRDHWHAANRLLVAVIVTVVAAFVLESAVGRLRPDQADNALTFAPFQAFTAFRNRGVCFPSGEAAMAFAMAYALSRLFPRLAAAFYALAALAAIARLVNGSHYLSDVAAGALLGLVCARAVYARLSISGARQSSPAQSP